jgi:dihydrofolate synthase/folylpolyglutamate synthase
VDKQNRANSDRLLEQLLALHPRLIDLSLDRMWRLLSALDHPQDKCPPIVHIAGTNGKGSTASLLRAMLEAEGQHVHAYYSPHLVDFHERIVLAGTQISEAHLADVLARVEAANDGAPITFFEVTTAAAFLAFSEHKADYLILEVGLGGRLDATNVVTPKLCAITPISLDHQDFLGDTILSIAEEKAGILKAGVPAVLAPQTPEVRSFLEDYAARKLAPLTLAGQDFTTYEEAGRLIFQHETGLQDLPLPALTGAHQLDNAGTALACAQALGVSPKAMAMGLETVRWPARLQKLSKGPMVDGLKARLKSAQVWLDGGHNQAAAQALANWLASQSGASPEVHIVMGLLNTKSPTDYLAALAETGAHIHTVPIANNEAALAPDILAAQAKAQGLKASAHTSIENALETITAPNALILIAGSLYLAGQVLAENG